VTDSGLRIAFPPLELKFEDKVRSSSLIAALLVASICAASARQLGAQAPCSIIPVMVDSARDEVLSALQNPGQVMTELRQDLHVKRMEEFSPVQVVRDGSLCARAAAGFRHEVSPGTRFVVLRLGPIYYARDPDQSRDTGIIMDSTFKVLVRLGAAIP
jgi:hypothetical protein